MKLYEVKALAHETQSRIRQDLNAWNDFLDNAHVCTGTVSWIRFSYITAA